jgi:hypothetical protein
MDSVVGIFRSRAQAESAARELLNSGVPESSIAYLTQQAPEQVESVRTTDAEGPGMGKTIGAYLGAVTGMGAGLSIGSAVASLMVPGVGPIMAVGLGAAAVLGLGGAAAGASVGESSEAALNEGVPRDDVFFYRDLLRRGLSLIIVSVDSKEKAELTESVLVRNGAEDTGEARKRWKASWPEGLQRAC